MLIDGGNTADSSLIIAYLKKLDINNIDYMICTHAHEDHVGGLSAPPSVMQVGSIYAPIKESDKQAYKTFKLKASEKNLEIIHPSNGDSFLLGSAAEETMHTDIRQRLF